MDRTQWDSKYLLLKSIFSVGKPDLESIATVVETSVRFSNSDLIVMEEIVIILEPFYEISVRYQVESIVSASLVVPSIYHLLCQLG